jgi:hypothetical protein
MEELQNRNEDEIARERKNVLEMYNILDKDPERSNLSQVGKR